MNRGQALKHIIEQIRQGELVFPTNVNASIKIQEALDDPDCGIETAANLVITEPLLAARLVAIANSVAYSRFGGGVTNVKTAVTILGFTTLRSIVISVVIRQLSLAITDPQLRIKANQLWEHSANVAALAHVIAKKISHVDYETAMFAGIVHEVAGFYLLSRAHEFPTLLDTANNGSDNTEEIEESSEAIIGRAVLKKLMVPAVVIKAVENLWNGLLVLPAESLGDILMVANDLASVVSPLDTRTQAVIDQSTSEIDFFVGDTTLNEITAESNEEVRSLTAALLM
ncbi:HDOD domain-containing protein [Undibacterium parvum]|uniref:HDOD domain-containing protein n=1 Tax=Undibacterium parvum TaxID=401471 RepID=A0A3S9HK50_9BURK|nr:HDOD domain-containing protein [Undibacterium parvum]AZP12468.1 HDOD domain-containing protein [Undibacterium parvum]